MKTIEIVVIVISVLIVVGVIAFTIIRKKINKKNGCVGGCCGCPHSGQCPSAKKNDTKKDTPIDN